MSRVVDVAVGGVRRRAVSSFRRRAECLPVAPLRPVVRRVSGAAARSRRLPFYPGLPVPVIRLRGVRYSAAPGSRANRCVVRGWLAGGRWSDGVGP